MSWETVIGIETHVQLSTKTKLFSRASTTFGQNPNTNVNLIDCGLPGILPSVNKEAFYKAIQNSSKVAMSLSDLFCVERHKPHFLDLVTNKLDITFANEQEITSLIDAKSFDEVVSFSKQLGKLIVVTRGKGGATGISGNEIVECGVQKNLKIVDLTGAGDLFAAGFLHGHVNNLSLKESLEKGAELSSKVIQQIGARL